MYINDCSCCLCNVNDLSSLLMKVTIAAVGKLLLSSRCCAAVVLRVVCVPASAAAQAAGGGRAVHGTASPGSQSHSWPGFND